MRVLLLLSLSLLVGCGGSFEQTIDLTYLTYGRPDYPMGTLVQIRYDQENGWQSVHEGELAKDAVMFNIPPYREAGFPFVTIFDDGSHKEIELIVEREHLTDDIDIAEELDRGGACHDEPGRAVQRRLVTGQELEVEYFQ